MVKTRLNLVGFFVWWGRAGTFLNVFLNVLGVQWKNPITVLYSDPVDSALIELSI